MESCVCSLEEKLKNTPIKTWDKAGKIMQGILDAVKYMHAKGYAHGDLALRNILLDRNDTVKLCDFGNTIKDEMNKQDDVCQLRIILVELIYQFQCKENKDHPTPMEVQKEKMKNKIICAYQGYEKIPQDPDNRVEPVLPIPDTTCIQSVFRQPTDEGIQGLEGMFICDSDRISLHISRSATYYGRQMPVLDISHTYLRQ